MFGRSAQHEVPQLKQRSQGTEAGGALAYWVILEPAEEGGYAAFVPSLTRCVSKGNTYEEALENVREAVRGWSEEAQEAGDAIPPRSCIVAAVEVGLPD